MFEIVLSVSLCFAAINECHTFEPASWITDSAHMQQAFEQCEERERQYMLLSGYKESDCFYTSPEKN